jgi:hypothetical protein
MQTFILIKKEYENSDYIVEGFFLSKKAAVDYIEEIGADKNDFLLYKADSKDIL